MKYRPTTSWPFATPSGCCDRAASSTRGFSMPPSASTYRLARTWNSVLASVRHVKDSTRPRAFIQPDVGDIGVRDDPNVLGLLERPAIGAGKTRRRAELIVAMIDRGTCRQHGRSHRLGAGFGVPVERARSRGFHMRARTTAGDRHSESAIRCWVCSREPRNPAASTAGTIPPSAPWLRRVRECASCAYSTC